MQLFGKNKIKITKKKNPATLTPSQPSNFWGLSLLYPGLFILLLSILLLTGLHQCIHEVSMAKLLIKGSFFVLLKKELSDTSSYHSLKNCFYDMACSQMRHHWCKKPATEFWLTGLSVLTHRSLWVISCMIFLKSCILIQHQFMHATMVLFTIPHGFEKEPIGIQREVNLWIELARDSFPSLPKA